LQQTYFSNATGSGFIDHGSFSIPDLNPTLTTEAMGVEEIVLGTVSRCANHGFMATVHA